MDLLAACRPSLHPAAMFAVTEAEAATIRTPFEQGGEFAAAVELRRLFPGVTDNAEARECAHYRCMEALAASVGRCIAVLTTCP